MFIRVLLPLTAIRLVAGKRLGGSKKGTVSRRPRLNSVIRGDVCLSRSLPSLPVPATVAAYSLPLLPSLSESFFSISSSPVPVFSLPRFLARLKFPRLLNCTGRWRRCDYYPLTIPTMVVSMELHSNLISLSTAWNQESDS